MNAIAFLDQGMVGVAIKREQQLFGARVVWSGHCVIPIARGLIRYGWVSLDAIQIELTPLLIRVKPKVCDVRRVAHQLMSACLSQAQ